MWNGDVVICCQDWEGKHAIGNILEEPLADIWHKKVAMETRIKGLKRSLDICNGCVTTSARIENVRFNHK
jgi:radical SAM protein with 4Fe4S-binding SPASM domain